MILDSVSSIDARLILWGDPRSMMASTSRGPSLFGRALFLIVDPSISDDSVENTDPVLELAHAFAVELTGRRSEALEIYLRFINHREEYVQLLARFLSAWSPDANLDELIKLHRIILELPNDTIEERRFRNVNLCRLITFCAEGGQREFLRMLLLEANELVQGDLAQGIKIVSKDWVDIDPSNWNFRASRNEFLVPWVHQMVGSDSLDQLEKMFLRKSRSIWAQRIEFESYPAGRGGVTAELQASWSGALWALPETRRSQALHLWASNEVENAGQVAKLWLLGSGQDIQPVLYQLEAFFSWETATEIVKELGLGAKVPKMKTWYEGLDIIWDHLPYETLYELTLNASLNLDLASTFASTQASFIAETAIRLDKDWLPIFENISPEGKSLLLLQASPNWASTLSQEVRSRLLDEMRSISPDLQSNWEQAVLLAALGENSERCLELVGELTPIAIANLSDYLDLGEEYLQTALKEFLSDVEGWISSRNNGVEGFGRSPIGVLRDLALKCGVRDSNWQHASALLQKIIASDFFSVPERVSALNALFDLREMGEVSMVLPANISQSKSNGFTDMPHEVLSLAWLSMVPPNTDWSRAGVQIVSASRASNPQIRSFSTLVTSRIFRKLDSGVLDSVVLAALHDPEPNVLFPLLRADLINSLGAEARSVFDARIVDVARTHRRWVREELARFVVANMNELMDRNSNLVTDLSTDKSWRVRRIIGADDTRVS